MNQKAFTPIESPAPRDGDEYKSASFLERADEFKAPPFLTGFTLVELLVVAAIIVLLSAIILANYRGSQSQFALQRSAHKLAQDTRRVQEMAMSVKECRVCNPIQIPPRYGVYFPPGDPPDPTLYKLFADLDDDGLFQPPPDQEISEMNYESGVRYITIEPGDVNCTGSLPIPDRRRVHITFSPPDPITEIKIGHPSFPLEIIDCFEVRIKLQFGTDGPIKSVKINRVGLIEVE